MDHFDSKEFQLASHEAVSRNLGHWSRAGREHQLVTNRSVGNSWEAIQRLLQHTISATVRLTRVSRPASLLPARRLSIRRLLRMIVSPAAAQRRHVVSHGRRAVSYRTL